MCPHNQYFYRTSLQKQASWVIMKEGAVTAATKCIFQKSFFVMSPNGAFLQNQRDASFCHRAESKLPRQPRQHCITTPPLSDYLAQQSDQAATRPVGHGKAVARAGPNQRVRSCPLRVPYARERKCAHANQEWN